MRPLRTEAADRTTRQRALQATPDMLARPSWNAWPLPVDEYKEETHA